MLKTKYFWVFAGSMLATGALFADPTYSESFESGNTWSGGTVSTTNYTPNATAGYPLSGAAHTKVLLIEGNAGYTHSGTALSGTPLVDMMVQTARPDDELGFPSSEQTNDIQIAVAVDSDGCFNAFCKDKSDDLGWYKLSSTVYPADGWARVSFLFDYAHNRCQIRIDGQPIMSANGYLTSSTSDGTAAGSWYKLAKATDGNTAVSSMKVIGCTAIDDVVLNVDSSYAYPLAESTDAAGVPYAWYDEYGIAWDSTGSYDGSGMTALNKYLSCLSPVDGQTFALKTMSVDTTNNRMVVEIPAPVTTAGRQVVLQYGTDPAFATIAGTVNVAAGATTVNVPLPATGVYFCRLLGTVSQ